ncbi:MULTISPECIES: NB-ARC domain-containing protein [unclassified Pseudofrankia]|uniref:NB-ARC domain-containing protein n=1 Tax=unclassified Pseudofrankia TaxID=2994372 RepID=UPI0010426E2E|nr:MULTISPECIES: NB-ARC domain-containing protein [unclassified Pseudofrankia]MDT3445924.1 NB-ARC domain-containing protein [Pseudofrankia sp. BMG5.37]
MGMGGAGKSTLARALLVDPALQESFPDGLLWVSVGQDPDLASGLTRVASALGDPGPITDVAAGRERLRRLLTTGRRLLVLDDVWDADALLAFDLGLPTVRILVTTRSRDVLPDDAPIAEVGTLDDEQGRAVLASYAGTAPSDLSPEADGVLAGCGGLVLALAVAGGMVADGASWADVAERLRRADLAALTTRFAGYPYPDLLRALDASVTALPTGERDRYRELAVFSGRGPVPAEAVVRLWRATAGFSEAAGKDLINRLGRRSLVQLDAGAVTLHDLAFDHVRTSLGPGQLQELHARFATAFLIDWGGLPGGLAALRGRDAIGQPDRYALSELVAHLVAAGLDDEMHALLAAQWPGPGGTAENTWFVLHEQADLPGAYLADVRTAWTRTATAAPQDGMPAVAADAAYADAGSADGEAPDAETARLHVLALRYALVYSSVVSRAGNLPGALLRRLIEAGRWPVDRALAYARSLATATSRAATLAVVVPFLPVDRRDAVVDEAWDTVAAGVPARERVAALATIGDLLEADRWCALVTEAVDSRLVITDPEDRAAELARLMPYLPRDQRTSAAAAAALATLTAVGDTFHRAFTLGMLAPHLPAEHLPAALEIALAIDEPFHQAGVLAELADRLPATLFPAAWAGLPDTPRWSRQARALVSLARHLPADERAAVIQRAWAASSGTGVIAREQVGIMAVLAPHLPAADREAAIAEVWRIVGDQLTHTDDTARASVIVALAPHLTGDLLAEAVEVAAAIGWGQCRVEALTALAPHLTDALADQALAAAAALDRPHERNRTIAQLAPHVPERLLPRALAITRTVDPPMHGAGVLTELAAHLPAGPRARVLEAALAAAGSVETPAMRAIALSRLASQLDPASLERALAAARAIGEPVARVKALAGLLPYLPAEQQAEVLREAWDVGYGVTRWPERGTVLAALAPHLPDDLVAVALEATIAAGADLQFSPVTTLAALAERLAAPARRAALLPLLSRLDVNRGLYPRTLLLLALAPALTEAERYDRFSALLDAIGAASAPMRVVTLEKIGARLPAGLFGRAVELAASTDHRQGPAQALKGLAPYLPDDLVPVALTTALSLEHPGTRGRAIAGLAPRLPAELARRAFDAALAIDTGPGRSEALAGLAPYLPEDLLLAAAETARRDSSTAAATAVAAAARGLRSAGWDRFRAATLADLARSSRAEVIEFLPTMLSAAPAGTGPAAVATATVDALTDVLRWWP